MEVKKGREKVTLEDGTGVLNTTPREGVYGFLKSIGNQREVIQILSEMNLFVKMYHISKWVQNNRMPSFIYEALVSIKNKDLRNSGKGDQAGAIDIFFKEVFVGRLELARDMTAVLKKRLPFRERE